MKSILFVGAEVMPFAATGGLGDVLGSLPREIYENGEGADVRVVMPLYNVIDEEWRQQMRSVSEFEVCVSWRKQYCGVKMLERDGVIYYFIDNQYYFYRDSMYGSYDDAERYAFFCLAVLEMMKSIDYYPDILHANDWHTALCPVYLRTLYSLDERYKNIKSVFTIHNIEYQGKFDLAIMKDVFSFDAHDRELLEYDGQINLMKAAIVACDAVTTVSPRYASEILSSEYSHGLHYILNMYSEKLSGIVNGIDYEYYDPSSTEDLRQKYSSRSPKKKSVNKTVLQEELSLPVNKDIPLLAVISRLASHKGIDLIEERLYNIVSNNDIQVVVLGKGERRYEDFFCRLQASFPDKVRALIMYDRALSKRIYAAADLFLMPSRSEPCGLAQMIASRYGAIPIVRETGGLYDSIKPYRDGDAKPTGNGFTFVDYNGEALEWAVGEALKLYGDEEKRVRLISKVMRTDFSWKSSAKKYLELYDVI